MLPADALPWLGGRILLSAPSRRLAGRRSFSAERGVDEHQEEKEEHADGPEERLPWAPGAMRDDPIPSHALNGDSAGRRTRPRPRNQPPTSLDEISWLRLPTGSQ